MWDDIILDLQDILLKILYASVDYLVFQLPS